MEKLFIFIWAASTQESYIKSYRAICVLYCIKYTYWSTKSTSIMYVIRKRKNKWAEMTKLDGAEGACLQLSRADAVLTRHLVKCQSRPEWPLWSLPLALAGQSAKLPSSKCKLPSSFFGRLEGILVVLSQLGHRPPPHYTISCSSLRASPKPVFLSVSLPHWPPHASGHPRLSSRNQFTGGWPRSHVMDVTGGHECLPRSVIITHTHREWDPKCFCFFLMLSKLKWSQSFFFFCLSLISHTDWNILFKC